MRSGVAPPKKRGTWVRDPIFAGGEWQWMMFCSKEHDDPQDRERYAVYAARPETLTQKVEFAGPERTQQFIHETLQVELRLYGCSHAADRLPPLPQPDVE